MTNTLVPGVYTSYELSGVRYSGKSAGVVGIVWKGESDETSVSTYTGSSQIAAAYGTESTLFALGRILFNNGAMTVKAVRIADDYTCGFDILMGERDITIMICDSTEADVHTKMSAAISKGGEDTKYRIGIAAADKSVAEIALEAKALNSERMVLVPDLQCAAALGGVILGSDDPSVPFNGAVLNGIEQEYAYSEEEVNTLIKGGVTPVRTIGGRCESHLELQSERVTR